MHIVSNYELYIIIIFLLEGIDDLRELLQELIEVAPSWFTVGVFLNIAHYKLEVIINDNRDQSMHV